MLGDREEGGVLTVSCFRADSERLSVVGVRPLNEQPGPVRIPLNFQTNLILLKHRGVKILPMILPMDPSGVSLEVCLK